VIKLRKSLYWDGFEQRISETIAHVKNGEILPVRRCAVFITEACNFKCSYCNVKQKPLTMSRETFDDVVKTYGKDAIIHITGGEPSVVSWLYEYLRENGDKYKFHLNTNAYITPPSKSIQRLKVSLDSCNSEYWNGLVGRNAFDTVVKNIQEAIPNTVTSITYTLTRENYQKAPEFIKFANIEFPGLYALFFSVYKGTNPLYVFTDEDVNRMFDVVIPEMETLLGEESLALLRETLDEKRRLIAGVRFPQNAKNPCYLSMSERVIAPDGSQQLCSHLYRDGIKQLTPEKHEKCLYGCNRRLVDFNLEVEKSLAL
jgi:MoaA/NifB/PqqE/SkfB family radical SAM enzyme